jgi:hypothetical protein
MTSNARHGRFRLTDVKRAFRAARAAGVPNPRVTINDNGSITITAGAPPAEDPGANEWDTVSTAHAPPERSNKRVGRGQRSGSSR